MRPVLLDKTGGEDALRALVSRFFELTEQLPEAHDIHRLLFRGHGVTHTRAAQVEFMSGFMGGRSYYDERHGHMDLREIHAHVPAREAAAEIWRSIMDNALPEAGHEGANVDLLRRTLRRTALMLVNAVPDWRAGEAP